MVPRYQQYRSSVKTAIEQGELAPGTRSAVQSGSGAGTAASRHGRKMPRRRAGGAGLVESDGRAVVARFCEQRSTKV